MAMVRESDIRYDGARMCARLVLLLLLATASAAPAQLIPQQPAPGQTVIGLPAQNFSFFKCFCATTVGGPLPSQLTFAPPPARQWNGSVYATSAQDAVFRAQNVCTAERRGSLFDCVNCRCDR